MRALCGAIITAGALIGLGLASIGMGTRYQGLPYVLADGKAAFVHFKDMDTAMMVSIVVLLLAVLVGLGTAFVGLAYHHERRHREHQHFMHTSGKTTIEP
jgi:hypothetical protein